MVIFIWVYLSFWMGRLTLLFFFFLFINFFLIFAIIDKIQKLTKLWACIFIFDCVVVNPNIRMLHRIYIEVLMSSLRRSMFYLGFLPCKIWSLEMLKYFTHAKKIWLLPRAMLTEELCVSTVASGMIDGGAAWHLHRLAPGRSQNRFFTSTRRISLLANSMFHL